MLLSVKHNPSRYSAEALAFLHTPSGQLDRSLSLPLQQAAWKEGSEPKAMQYLYSTSTQRIFNMLATAATTSTLEVERKHCRDRRSEKRTVVPMSTVTRDSLIRQYRTQCLQPSMTKAEQAAKERIRRLKYSNVWSLAREEMPSLFPMPQGQQFGHGSSQPDALRPDQENLDAAAQQEFVRQNKQRLEQKLQTLRASASADLHQLQTVGLCTWPKTMQQWMSWMDDNDNLFREHVTRCRRGGQTLNYKVQAQADLPPLSVARVDANPRGSQTRIRHSHIQSTQLCALRG